MDKPTKPNDLIPRSFGGTKNNFSASLQSSGFEDGVPAIYGGDNLNYQLNATGKELDYCEKIVDFINEIPIGKTITVDNNNKLVYGNHIDSLPIATTSTTGVVQADGVTIDVNASGVISAQKATTITMGIVKPDNTTIAIDENGVISTNIEGKYPHTFNSGNVTSGNPDLINATLSQDTEYTTPATYTFTISTAGYYPIALVGGGGSGASGINSLGYMSYCGGGSGAAFVGEVYLNTGSHSITVGGQAGNSVLKEGGTTLITVGGGTNGAMTAYNLNRAGGYGGTLTIATGVLTQNISVQSNGNNGGFNNGNVQQAGGASVYGGYGKGANSSNAGRTNGYFTIQLPSGSVNINYKVGGTYPLLTGTLKTGEQFTLDGVNSDDITGLADGTYIKYVGSDGSSDFIKGKFTVSKTQPSTPSANDVWVNNSVNPIEVKQYDGSVWADYDKIPIGKVKIASGGINSVSTMPYNIDYVGSRLGYSMPSKRILSLTLGTTGTNYTAPANGYFMLTKVSSAASQNIHIFNNSNGLGMNIWTTAASQILRVFTPCIKGDVVTINYSLAGTTNAFQFVYSGDSQGEA